jgi:elongation factor P
MLGITDLKTGVVFEDGSQPWLVLEYQHSKMGRGGAVLKTKIKNLVTGAVVDRTFKDSDKFPPVTIERKKAQYLYAEGEGFVFMDEETYDQTNFGKEVVGNALDFIIEGESVDIQYYKGKPIALNVPLKVIRKVTEAPEAEKGNTSGNARKTITLETGLSILGPMFIKTGDKVVVDTRDGSYVERA